MVQFIAESGALSTFTFDKRNFITFTESSGSIQTADKSAELPVLGYRSVIVKHSISINGQDREVTTKLQPVYYAPGMSYCLLSVSSLIRKIYLCLGTRIR